MMQSVVALELAERASDEATVVHPSVFRFEGASSPRSRHELTKMETQVGFNSRRDAQRNLRQMRALTKAPRIKRQVFRRVYLRNLRRWRPSKSDNALEFRDEASLSVSSRDARHRLGVRPCRA
jgi:hypothetical protein